MGKQEAAALLFNFKGNERRFSEKPKLVSEGYFFVLKRQEQALLGG